MSILSSRTFSGLLLPLCLLLVPVVTLYSAIIVMLLGATDSWLRIPILIVAGGAVIGLIRLIARNLIRVEFNRVVILESRDTQDWLALLRGFHLILAPGLYRERAQASTWQVELHRDLQNVTVIGGPQLNLRLNYTIQHDVPRDVLRLPQAHGAPAAVLYEHRVLGNLFVSSKLPEVWQQKHGIPVDGALRRFFGTVWLEELYDPFNGVLLGPDNLCAELNRYLDQQIKRWGFKVQVVSLQVTDTQQIDRLAWINRMTRDIIPAVATLKPQEAAAVAAALGRSSIVGVWGAPGGPSGWTPGGNLPW